MAMSSVRSTDNVRSTDTVSKILDAAVVCSQRTGLGKTTMSDIIAESGLARTTVYRYCKTRDDIISQVVLRDIDYLIQQLEGIRAANDGDLETQLVEVLYFTLSEISSRPLLKALFSQDPTLLNKLGLANDGVMKYMRQAIRPVFDRLTAAGRMRKKLSLEDYIEWNGRITMSFVLTPYRHQDNPVKMRNYIRNFILPSLLIQQTG
jgi:AcrR family transcriptional regulator